MSRFTDLFQEPAPEPSETVPSPVISPIPAPVVAPAPEVKVDVAKKPTVSVQKETIDRK